MIGHPHQWYGAISHAQHGDDFALLNLFKRLGVDRGTYVDVGAHHPYELSNTALLYERGWRGICVEANEAAIQLFSEQRPQDRIVFAAVTGEIEGEVTFYRNGPNGGLNSINRKNLGSTVTVEAVRVPALTLERVVQEYAESRWPDLLSVDAEGADLDILRSIQHSKIGVILIEARSHCGDITSEVRLWAASSGYFVHSWCGSNMLLMRNDLKDQAC